MAKLKKRPLLNYACLAFFTLISLGFVASTILEPQIAFTPNANITPGLYPEYYELSLAILLFSIVALHFCIGTSHTFEYFTPYATYADGYSFIAIYSESPHLTDRCWDVSSKATLRRSGGGDSNAIANQVTFAIGEYGNDPNRVYVTGTSSGALMVTVMAATYPDLFAAGTTYSGVAASCFWSNTNQVNKWNNSCSQGQVIATPQYWASTVKGFMDQGQVASKYPRMQIYHGTADDLVAPVNFNETCKQFIALNGKDYYRPDRIQANFPLQGYSTTTWGLDTQNPIGRVAGVLADGVGHTVPIIGDQDLRWFGLGPYEAQPQNFVAEQSSTTDTSKSEAYVAGSPYWSIWLLPSFLLIHVLVLYK